MCSNVSAFNSNTSLTNGTTQTSSTEDFNFNVFWPCTDVQFFFLNGNFAGGTSILNPIGNAITFKSCLEINGNFLPLSISTGSTGTTMTTPAQSGISTTVNGAATSASQTLTAIPQGCVVGASLHFGTSNVTYPVVSIASNVVTLTTSFTSTNGETVTVVAEQGTGNILGDGQYTWSNPYSAYLSSGNNIIRTFWSVPAGGHAPLYYSRGYNGGTGGAWRSSDVSWGGTTDKADYSNGPTGSPGYGTSGQYEWAPGCVIARQLTASPVVGIFGDSIAFGTNNNNQEGYIGTALAGASVNYWNAGFGGSTVLNQSRYTTALAEIAHKYIDAGIIHIGTNDLFNAETFSQMQNGILQYIQNLGAGGVPMWLCTILPRTTSTDSWATVANQTVSAYEPLRIQWNNWLRDTSSNGFTAYMSTHLVGLAKLGGVFDVCPGYEYNSSGTALTTGAMTYTTYGITCTSANATAGAVYWDSSNNPFTVGPTIAAGTLLVTTGTTPPVGMTLTKHSGTGDATITFSSFTASSANQQAFATFGDIISNGTANYYVSDGIHPKLTANSVLGANLTNLAGTFGSLYSTTIGDTIWASQNADWLTRPRTAMPSLIASIDSVQFDSLAPR